MSRTRAVNPDRSASEFPRNPGPRDRNFTARRVLHHLPDYAVLTETVTMAAEGEWSGVTPLVVYGRLKGRL
jgi:hypothetical protein